jgi:hypothetical protein
MPNISNLPTQYSSSRIENQQMGGGLIGNSNGSGGFAVLRNSSHYNRNMSPQPQGSLINTNGIPALSSGGYMGQGLGILHPSMAASDANSSSFYSNNTSAISNNLNNSRYLLNRRENQMVMVGKLNGGSVGKVVPNTHH